MALINRTVILGIKSLRFARNGAADGEDTTAADHKPLTASAAYESLGRVEKASLTNKEESIKIRNASSGAYKNELSIPMGQELSLGFTMQSLNQLLLELLYLTDGPITVATPIQPMNKKTSVQGWLEVTRTDQTKTNTLVEFVWVELSMSKHDTAEKAYTQELMAEVLDNPLNTLNIAALAAN